MRSRKRARAVAPWRHRDSRSDRAASAVRDAARRRARLAERAAPGASALERARARSRARRKKTTVRKSRRLGRATSGGRRLDARAAEGGTAARRERGSGRGRAPRWIVVSARRAESSGPSRTLRAVLAAPPVARAFHHPAPPSARRSGIVRPTVPDGHLFPNAGEDAPARPPASASSPGARARAVPGERRAPRPRAPSPAGEKDPTPPTRPGKRSNATRGEEASAERPPSVARRRRATERRGVGDDGRRDAAVTRGGRGHRREGRRGRPPAGCRSARGRGASRGFALSTQSTRRRVYPHRPSSLRRNQTNTRH